MEGTEDSRFFFTRSSSYDRMTELLSLTDLEISNS